MIYVLALSHLPNFDILTSYMRSLFKQIFHKVIVLLNILQLFWTQFSNKLLNEFTCNLNYSPNLPTRSIF